MGIETSNSIDTSLTTKAAIEWTEKSQNSKLKEIKDLLGKYSNENIGKLSKLIQNKEYKKFQKEVGYKGKLDGMLGAASLSYTKLFVQKEQKEDAATSGEGKDIKSLQEEILAENALLIQLQKPGEIWNKNELKEIGTNNQISGNFENKSKNEIGSGEWIIGNGERQLKKGIDLLGDKLTLKNISIPMYDHEERLVLWKDISETFDSLSIKFMGDNISVNDKYVIHPQGTMCLYNEAKKGFLDVYAASKTTVYQDSLLKPLYDYLKTNKSKFEKKEYRYISEPIVADGKGKNPVKFDDSKEGNSSSSEKDYSDIGFHKEIDKNGNTIWVSDPIIADGKGKNNINYNSGRTTNKQFGTESADSTNMETGKKINENFNNIEIADFKESSESGIYIGKNIDLHVSNISKKGNTLILNNGKIEIMYNNGQVSYKLRENNHSINVGLDNMGYQSHDTWKQIYRTLNKKYFS